MNFKNAGFKPAIHWYNTRRGHNMKIIKWILIVIVLLIIALAAFLWYLGVFSTPKVVEQKIGPFTLVYEEYTGPYSGSGTVMARISRELKAEGISISRGFGIYLNNPNTTVPDQLKSDLGFILENKDLARVKDLKKKFKVMKWEAKDCLVAEFPLRNDLSYMVGPMKAYPELNKAIKAGGYKMGGCLEIYDMPAMKILFVFEIIK